MSDMDIPEDIFQAAEETFDLMLCNCREAGDVRADSIRDIARAILAERERGAKIIKDAANGWQDSSSEWMILTNLAAAIRTPDTPSGD